MTQPSLRGLRAINRRRFLTFSAGLAAGTLVTACSTDTAPTSGAAVTGQPTVNAQPTAGAVQPTAGAAQPTAATTAPMAYQEAPQLADLVKQGKLPPVAQRLPKNPVVITPLERVGKYGGTWRAGLLGGQDNAWMVRTIGYDYLVRWDPEWDQIIPNLAASYKATTEAKEYTFTLREGLKWSDGQPFTADDILFWYEDVAMDKQVSPGGVPTWLTAGGKPVVVQKVDAYTVKFLFDNPNGLFLQNLATPSGEIVTRYPKHYLQQFHKKYNTTNLDQLVKENNAEDWVKLFQLKGAGVPGTPYSALWQNQDLPGLYGWYLSTPYGSGTRVVAERNPYYWKVDTAGNQLPYLDRVTYEVAQDAQTLVLKALNGEIDMQDRHINSLSNKAVFVDNQQKGQYRLWDIVYSEMNTALIYLNLTHKDPTKRQIFQNKDFRIGLSHAINRQEIIDVVYVGQGTPYQAAPRPESEFYNERLAKQYTAFDLKKANEALDRAFPQKDGEGFRLGPDGKRIAFVVETTTAIDPTWADVLNLVKKHWGQVGVDMQVKVEDRALMWTRKDANEVDAWVWKGDSGLQDLLLGPGNYFPMGAGGFASAWGVWYSNPSGAGARTQPEEPPAATKKQMELYDQLKATGDERQQAELMRQILEIAADQFYSIGISLYPNGYGIVRNNFHNVPKSMPGAWLYPNPAPTNPPQYFIE